MRTYFHLGHRLPLGFYGGVSVPFGSFHHSRILTPSGSQHAAPGVWLLAIIFLGVFGMMAYNLAAIL